jgi:hypothetical protein
MDFAGGGALWGVDPNHPRRRDRRGSGHDRRRPGEYSQAYVRLARWDSPQSVQGWVLQTITQRL